jgi:hypothetical protein
MDASMMARLKELEDENRRLKKMYAEERFKAEIIRRRWQKSGEAIAPKADGTGRGPRNASSLRNAGRTGWISIFLIPPEKIMRLLLSITAATTMARAVLWRPQTSARKSLHVLRLPHELW